MEIRVTAEDAKQLDRIEALLRSGKPEYQVAEELGFSRHKLTAFLTEHGFGVETKRRLVRLGSRESYADCLAHGVIVVEGPAQEEVPA